VTAFNRVVLGSIFLFLSRSSNPPPFTSSFGVGHVTGIPVITLLGSTVAAVPVAPRIKVDSTMVSLSFSNTLVQSFASKPFIQQALQNVYHPTSVLNFWFGVDTTTAIGMEQLRCGSKECMSDMAALWYGGGPDYDKLCQPFADVIHLAGTKSLPSPPPSDNNNIDGVGNIWYTTVDGNIAQVILIDQLARNIFRGTDNAFKYESLSLSIARQLSTQYLKQQALNGEWKHLNLATISPKINDDKKEDQHQPLPVFDSVSDKMYPGFSTVLATSLMHSEQACDHQLCLALLEHSICLSKEDEDGAAQRETTSATTKTTKQMLCDWYQYQLTFALDHKNVIDRFGRYPHRNRILNRTSTEEEIRWLSDTENLPGWAKSQG
jgi:uncharacterized protein (DUF924 family)